MRHGWQRGVRESKENLLCTQQEVGIQKVLAEVGADDKCTRESENYKNEPRKVLCRN